VLPVQIMTDARCAVCDGKLDFHARYGDRRDTNLCKSLDCLRIWKLKATLDPGVFAWKVECHKRFQKNTRRASRLRKKHIKKKIEQEHQENKACISLLSETNSFYAQNANALPTLLLPSGPDKIVNLSKKRITQYTHHLYKVISSTFSGSDVKKSETGNSAELKQTQQRIKQHSVIGKLNVQFCTTCRGGCCAQGNEEAYIEDATIRRIRRIKPTMRPRDILEVYLSALSPKVIKESCINHTINGCGLDREFRSGVCNRFYYAPLLAYFKKYTAEPDEILGALVINRKEGVLGNPNSLKNPIVSVSIVESDQIIMVKSRRGLGRDAIAGQAVS